MTKYNSEWEFWKEVYTGKQSDETSMKEFNEQIELVKNFTAKSIKLKELDEIVTLLKNALKKHKEFYPNRTKIMQEQEKIINALIKDIENEREKIMDETRQFIYNLIREKQLNIGHYFDYTWIWKTTASQIIKDNWRNVIRNMLDNGLLEERKGHEGGAFLTAQGINEIFGQ